MGPLPDERRAARARADDPLSRLVISDDEADRLVGLREEQLAAERERRTVEGQWRAVCRTCPWEFGDYSQIGAVRAALAHRAAMKPRWVGWRREEHVVVTVQVEPGQDWINGEKMLGKLPTP